MGGKKIHFIRKAIQTMDGQDSGPFNFILFGMAASRARSGECIKV